MRNPNDPTDVYTPDPPQPKDEFVLKVREALTLIRSQDYCCTEV